MSEPDRRAEPSAAAADLASTGHLARVVAAAAGAAARPRPEQSAAVEALVDQRRRVLVVMPTGWGKSAVYLGATAALRAGGGGPTIVVSPLLALMRDQVAAAERVGLRAATVNSANVDDWAEVFDELAGDRVDILLVSPERLANPRFEAVAMPLLARAGLLVIDEAHCISDWGFDFRPDYQRIANLLMGMAEGAPVLAATATANERVTADVAEQLGPDTLILRGPLARSTLTLSVVPGLNATQRAAWVADALPGLPGSGIVYCLTVAQAETLAQFLTSQGLDVRAYTGAMAAQERAEVEAALRRNEVKAVVATSALGMGYDKPDLGFCIHVGAPDSPVSYYQQVGRAGRAIEEAAGVLLPAPDIEEGIWRYFATAAVPTQENADKVLAALAATEGPMSLPALEAATGVRRGRLEMLLKTLRVAGAVARVDGGWSGTGERWHVDEARYAAIASARSAEQALMREYCAADRCLMRILTESLGDPDTGDCGRCSACTGVLPRPGLHPAAALVERAREFARSRPVEVAPRRQWPTGLPSARGRIRGAVPGRAVMFGDDDVHADLALELAGPDAPASAELLAAAIETLARWSTTWDERPRALVVCPSTRPIRTGTLAAGIAAAGGLPLLDNLVGTVPVEDEVASPHARVTSLLAGMQCSPVPAEPILLVADRARSTWTLTVAAAKLRDAGAKAVMPFVAQLLP